MVTDADPTENDDEQDDEQGDQEAGVDDPADADDPSAVHSHPEGNDGANSGDAETPVDIAMSSRAARLSQRVADSGPTLLICLAKRTLEWDLVVAGNWDLLLDALSPLRPRVSARLRRTMTEATTEECASALVEATKKIKGEFAQSLVDMISSPIVGDSGVAGRNLVPPRYLRLAVEHVTAGTPPPARPSQNTSGNDAPASRR